MNTFQIKRVQQRIIFFVGSTLTYIFHDVRDANAFAMALRENGYQQI